MFMRSSGMYESGQLPFLGSMLSLRAVRKRPCRRQQTCSRCSPGLSAQELNGKQVRELPAKPQYLCCPRNGKQDNDASHRHWVFGPGKATLRKRSALSARLDLQARIPASITSSGSATG